MTKWKSLLFIILAGTITFAAHSSSLNNQFVNLDDGPHLYANPLVRSISSKNIAEIFKPSNLVNRTYIPLTILSFAVEYHFFKLDPFIYHLNNVLLHVVVTGLVFVFALNIKLNLVAAFFAALLFGVHPMHVESVAWVTERKDVLYSLFYMLALISYVNYIEKKRVSSYVLSCVFCVLSMLAKSMALSLPLILILIDIYHRRKFDKWMIIDKILYVLLIVPITLITFVQNTAVFTQDQSILNQILIAVWSFTFYPIKFFVPLDLSPLYAFPKTISLITPAYALAVGVLMLMIALTWIFRRHRLFLFAVLFYMCSIFFLVRFTFITDFDMVSDRFMYLPSLGFCLWLGYCVGHSKSFKPVVIGVSFIVLAVLSFATFQQSKIWYDGQTLWTSVLAKQPNHPKANNNLADYWMKKGVINDDVRRYIETALKADPDYADAHVNKGSILAQRRQTQQAIQHFETALALQPDHATAHANLGTAYYEQQNLEQAVLHLKQSIKLNFDPPGVYKTLGEALIKTGKPEEGNKYLLMSIK